MEVLDGRDRSRTAPRLGGVTGRERRLRAVRVDGVGAAAHGRTPRRRRQPPAEMRPPDQDEERGHRHRGEHDHEHVEVRDNPQVDHWSFERASGTVGEVARGVDLDPVRATGQASAARAVRPAAGTSHRLPVRVDEVELFPIPKPNSRSCDAQAGARRATDGAEMCRSGDREEALLRLVDHVRAGEHSPLKRVLDAASARARGSVARPVRRSASAACPAGTTRGCRSCSSA